MSLHLSITVSVDPGTSIDDAFNEAVTLAGRVGVEIEFTFNGVSCHAFPYGDPQQGVKEFHDALLSKHQYKHAFAR